MNTNKKLLIMIPLSLLVGVVVGTIQITLTHPSPPNSPPPESLELPSPTQVSDQIAGASLPPELEAALEYDIDLSQTQPQPQLSNATIVDVDLENQQIIVLIKDQNFTFEVRPEVRFFIQTSLEDVSLSPDDPLSTLKDGDRIRLEDISQDNHRLFAGRIFLIPDSN